MRPHFFAIVGTSADPLNAAKMRRAATPDRKSDISTADIATDAERQAPPALPGLRVDGRDGRRSSSEFSDAIGAYASAEDEVITTPQSSKTLAQPTRRRRPAATACSGGGLKWRCDEARAVTAR